MYTVTTNKQKQTVEKRLMIQCFERMGRVIVSMTHSFLMTHL